MSKHGITLDLVETGGIQQLHEGGDNRGKWRRMSTRPFRILMRVSKIEISIISKIEEKAKKKESFSQNFFHPWKTNKQLLEIESLKLFPLLSKSISFEWNREREREWKEKRCVDKQQSHLSNFFLSVFFYIYQRFGR